jgi:hypothetical protein
MARPPKSLEERIRDGSFLARRHAGLLAEEVLDRTLGRSKQRHEDGRSQWPGMETALADAREKLAARLGCETPRNMTSR